jgi:putative ABC transport system substrate-binding protein
MFRHPIRRREVLLAMGGVLCFGPRSLHAQQGKRIHRVGVLHPGQIPTTTMRISAFREGLLAAQGPAGEDIEILARIAEGNIARLSAMAAELVSTGVDALLAVSPTGVNAARNATKVIPIIAVDLETDPVASGWAASVARPGGNVTGVFLDSPEFSVKSMQMLRESIPAAQKLAILWDPAIGSLQRDAVMQAAGGLGLALEVIEVRGIADLEPAFNAISRTGAGGVLMLSTPLFSSSMQLVAYLSERHRLPGMTVYPDFARNGGLMAYGPDLQALFRQAGEMMRKVLSGMKPGELPIQRPTHFHLTVNLRAARALGLTVPPQLIARADEVIE